MPTQICSKCKIEKDLDDFSPRKDRPRGKHYSCKDCNKKAAKEYRTKVSQTEDQKLRARERSAKWRKENPDWASEQKKNWSKRFPHKKLELSRRYDLTKTKRTPSWLTKEHFKEIEYFYWLAKDLKCLTGEEYHVDHIVPLQGKTVSGLHVPWNLQVIPKSLNLSKGNSYGES
jgi:hypothetical protein